MGEIQLENLKVDIPLGKITTKLQATVYVKKGDEFVKTNEYLQRNKTFVLYGIEDGTWANMGNNCYVTELDNYHFDISYGQITTLTDSVQTCSRNGFSIRKLKSGTKLNVRDILSLNATETLYKVGDKEYILSSMPVSFVMGDMLVLKDSICHIDNGKILRFQKGEIIPYQNVSNNQMQLLTGEWINPQTINCKLYLPFLID